MPFTLAHPAAVLPLRRFCPRFLSLPALVVGSVCPDAWYAFAGLGADTLAHRFVGSFVLCLPAGLVLLGLFVGGRAWFVRLVPGSSQAVFGPLCLVPLGSFGVVVCSLLVGTWTHLLWDSFTNQQGQATVFFSGLQAAVGSVAGHQVRVCHVLWYAFSFAGVACVLVAYERWLMRVFDGAIVVAAQPGPRGGAAPAGCLGAAHRSGASSHPRVARLPRRCRAERWLGRRRGLELRKGFGNEERSRERTGRKNRVYPCPSVVKEYCMNITQFKRQTSAATRKPKTGDKRPEAASKPAAADVAIVGMGYVGLPLALQFAGSGVRVVGLDIDSVKVEAINQGRSYIRHIGSEAIARLTRSQQFSASTDFSLIQRVGAVIICVPTPLNKNREPDISFIVNTGKSIAPHLQKGTLVVLEFDHLPRHHR